MSNPLIQSIDHLVLTVASIDATLDFYCGKLGCEEIRFGEGRVAIGFGAQKINLHQVDRTFEPKANAPTPGSADLCFLTGLPLSEVAESLRQSGIVIEEGPVPRTGAEGPILSLYMRDPDGNLIEISERTG